MSVKASADMSVKSSADMSVKSSQELRQSADTKPTPPPNPKDVFGDSVSKQTTPSASHENLPPKSVAPKSVPPKPTQATQMRNKFEEALMSANQPSTAAPPVAIKQAQATA